MLSKRFQIGQLILNAVLVGLLLIALSAQRWPTYVRAAGPEVPSVAAVPGGPGYVMVPATAF